MTIGERIKIRRKEMGLSVDDLAQKLKKNRATIYRYESNDIEKLPANILVPLAEALGVTPAWLMGYGKERAPRPHSMRHTYATTLLFKGMDVQTVAALLGDTVQMVITTYIHYVDEMRKNAAESVAKIFG